MVYELIEEGVGVVWSTAYLDEAENCAEVIVLNEGRVLFQGEPRAMTAQMAGRVFGLRGTGRQRRKVLARALMLPDIVDGVMQGEVIRLVTRKDAPRRSWVTSRKQAKRPWRQWHRASRMHSWTRSAVSPSAPSPRRCVSRSNAVAQARSRRVASRAGSEISPRRTTYPSRLVRVRYSDCSGLTVQANQQPQDDVRAAAAQRGRGACRRSRPLPGAVRSTRAPGLYGAEVLALRRPFCPARTWNSSPVPMASRARAGARRVARVAEAFDLVPHLKEGAAALPLGFKQRLALCCAIMHDPPVLFLDEPTSGVDPLTRREFWGVINAMVARGVTIMVTTHFMDEASTATASP